MNLDLSCTKYTLICLSEHSLLGEGCMYDLMAGLQPTDRLIYGFTRVVVFDMIRIGGDLIRTRSRGSFHLLHKGKYNCTI